MTTMTWLKDHYRGSRDAIYPGRALERYRMGMKSGGAIRGVRVLVGSDSCPSCRALAGAAYSLDDAPELPNPGCSNPNGCHCAYRPVMAYDDGEDAQLLLSTGGNPGKPSREAASPSPRVPASSTIRLDDGD